MCMTLKRNSKALTSNIYDGDGDITYLADKLGLICSAECSESAVTASQGETFLTGTSPRKETPATQPMDDDPEDLVGGSGSVRGLESLEKP